MRSESHERSLSDCLIIFLMVAMGFIMLAKSIFVSPFMHQQSQAITITDDASKHAPTSLKSGAQAEKVSSRPSRDLMPI